MNRRQNSASAPRGLPRPVRAAMWAVLAMAVFSVVPVGVKQLSDTMSSSQVVFLRSATGLAIMTGFFAWRGFGHLRTRRTGLYVLRSGLNAAGMVMWFYALAQMPFGDAVAIQFTMPLFTVILAMLFLRERIGIHRAGATLIGFAGTLIVLQPGFRTLSPAAISVLGSAILYAATVIVVKFTVRTDTSAAINFYSNLYMTLFAAVPCAFDWAPVSWSDAPALAVLAVSGVLAPWIVTRALALSDASAVAPFDFLRMPFSALMGYLFFAQVSGVWTWVGAAVIFGSTYYITRREARRARDRNGSREDGEAPERDLRR